MRLSTKVVTDAGRQGSAATFGNVRVSKTTAVTLATRNGQRRRGDETIQLYITPGAPGAWKPWQ